MPKFRFKYAKHGLLSYLSHLDMIRLWQRAFARANVRLEMSQGHSPRPKLGFGPPLSVGHSSDVEYLDASVRDAAVTSRLAADLNEVLPADIRVVNVRRLLPREAAVSAGIETIVYRVKVATRLIGSDEGKTPREMLDEFLARDDVVIERERKGRIQQIDLRRTVRDISVVSENGSTVITMAIDLTRGAYPKPEEVLRAVFRVVNTLVDDIEIRRIDVRFRPGKSHPAHTIF